MSHFRGLAQSPRGSQPLEEAGNVESSLNVLRMPSPQPSALQPPVKDHKPEEVLGQAGESGNEGTWRGNGMCMSGDCQGLAPTDWFHSPGNEEPVPWNVSEGVGPEFDVLSLLAII